MDIIIGCQISLSKKLRALIGNSETNITMVSDTLKDGKGRANIMLSLDNLSKKDVEELVGKETSIMFTPDDVKDNIAAGSESVANIFSSGANNGKRDAISRIAATTAPERGEQGYAIKSREEVEEETPAPFAATKNQGFQKFVRNFDQLLEISRKAATKEYDGDMESIKQIKDKKQRDRKMAIAMEEQQRAEAIDIPVFIVNDKYASLTINDLGINLVLNVPFNLANISAKRILASKELELSIKTNKIKIISPDEVKNYVRKVEEAEPSVEVFGGASGSARRAAEAIEEGRTNSHEIKAEPMDLTNEVNRFAEASEQEQMAGMIGQVVDDTQENGNKFKYGNAPKFTGGSGLKKIHGDSMAPTTPNKAGIKPIRKTGIEY